MIRPCIFARCFRIRLDTSVFFCLCPFPTSRNVRGCVRLEDPPLYILQLFQILPAFAVGIGPWKHVPLTQMAAASLRYARDPQVNFAYVAAPSVSHISPTPICKDADSDVIYRNVEVSQRLRFGSASSAPLFDHTPRGRNNSQRDKLISFSNFLRKAA